MAQPSNSPSPRISEPDLSAAEKIRARNRRSYLNRKARRRIARGLPQVEGTIPEITDPFTTAARNILGQLPGTAAPAAGLLSQFATMLMDLFSSCKKSGSTPATMQADCTAPKPLHRLIVHRALVTHMGRPFTLAHGQAVTEGIFSEGLTTPDYAWQAADQTCDHPLLQ